MNDLISRQAAVDEIKEIEIYEWHDAVTVERIIEHLNNLPSAEPEQQTGQWEYDEDNGNVMCRCPKCSGRLIISLYQYKNPYKFCPYCGKPLAEGKLTQKRKCVYGLEQEAEE